MPRDLPIGNGQILIAFGTDSLLREFDFPHVGQESHTRGRPFRFGVWVDGKFSWVPNGWKISQNYVDDSLVTEVKLLHEEWKLSLLVHDLVDFHENIYLKKITVQNQSDQKREIRLFLAHDFNIYGNKIGDTAAFRPEINALLHYKGDRYFLINLLANGKVGVEHYATGNKGGNGYEGTWKDAEDGQLSGNPIAQGSIDSVIGIYLQIPPHAEQDCYYWITVGTQWADVKALNETVIKKKPETILKRTQDYWNLWVNKEGEETLKLLPPHLIQPYKRSLLICRTQVNQCGTIIAATDSDAIQFNRDTYSYMWPRDAALTTYALDLAGYDGVTRNFFHTCAKIIEKEGYFLHKYTPSGSLASSWHPWIKNQKPQLPIQEDETALVLWALWKHYERTKDVEWIKPLYKPLIKRAADFMMTYRTHETGLPLPSYDLWEERQGILTFTLSAVFGGLMAAAHFTEAFGETSLAEEYRLGATQLRQAMDKHLFLEKENRFARMIQYNADGSLEIDRTIDASVFGIFAFGAYAADDPKVISTMAQVKDALWCKTDVGGVARYENDSYFRQVDTVPGNPWMITTLWLAQYEIAAAKRKEDLEKGVHLLNWAASHALASGVMPEQVHPITGAPLSVSPLTWSHATFIATVQQYLNRLRELSN